MVLAVHQEGTDRHRLLLFPACEGRAKVRKVKLCGVWGSVLSRLSVPRQPDTCTLIRASLRFVEWLDGGAIARRGSLLFLFRPKTPLFILHSAQNRDRDAPEASFSSLSAVGPFASSSPSP
jgi:hypothetical protein